MKNNFNDFLRDFLNEDFFWSNSTTYPFVRGLNNKVPVTKRDYSKNLPTTNVFEDEWSYKYELATPGFTKKELSVELENNMLNFDFSIFSCTNFTFCKPCKIFLFNKIIF